MPKITKSILEKVSTFMKIPITLPNSRKLTTLNLIFFKKISGTAAKYKFHKHYNYGFITEYQFSPSRTPLIRPHKKKYYFSTERKNKKNFHSMLLMCMCLGVQETEGICSSMEVQVLPAIKDGITSCEEEEMEMLETGSGENGFASVDERAERFIEKFYAQIKSQNQQSITTVSLLLAD